MPSSVNAVHQSLLVLFSLTVRAIVVDRSTLHSTVTFSMPAKVKPGIVAKNSQKKDSEVSQGQSQIVRNAATEVVVKLNQKQSLNIVQTSVAASLSTILFIKNVFPVDYYERRTYNMRSPEFTYLISPSDARSVMKQESDENTVTWDMLVPGKHRHVDKLLSWLVRTIRPSLKQQLTFYAERNRRSS